MQTLKIIVADNQPEIRAALKLVIELEPGFVVAGEIDGLNSLRKMTETVRADVVLLDWQLRYRDEQARQSVQTGCSGSESETLDAVPPGTGLYGTEPSAVGASKVEPSKAELLRELRLVNPKIKIVALSGRPESQSDALAAGVDVFVCKSESPDRLLDALRFIYRQYVEGM